ncbi:MAG TPA: methyltransferase domain-containing protein [Candidatus Hydrogenedentes bacterium]|nr:methyltransferase domain-containing protein [Candidatus Hydrogenedentota bacterium]
MNNLDYLLSYIPASAGRILDMGRVAPARCRALKERGAEVMAVVESEEEAEGLAEWVSGTVHGDWQTLELPFREDYFECVVCEDLLPRLRDPKPVLERLARMLSPHGVFVMTVPNLQYYKVVTDLAEGRWVLGEQGVLARAHIRFFTAYEAVRLVDASGLEARGCSALVVDDPAAVPLDTEGCIQVGRIRLGPLNDTEYLAFRTQEYVIVATRRQ